jgi:hypothetical protein
MTKRTWKMSLAAAVAALSFGAGCDTAEDAQLVIRNDLGLDVAELSLEGTDDTGDLLDGATIPKDAEGVVLENKVMPGKYTWHVVYLNSLKKSDDGAEEFELFPGQNHLVLQVLPTL